MGSSSGAAAPEPDPKFNRKKKETYEGDSTLGDEGTMERTQPEGADASKLHGSGAGVKNSKAASGASATGGDENSDGTRKRSPAAPRAGENEETDGQGQRAPLINLDDKVAWRAAPIRSRTSIKTQTASARINRVPTYPKSEWIPVGGESKVAKK